MFHFKGLQVLIGQDAGAEVLIFTQYVFMMEIVYGNTVLLIVEVREILYGCFFYRSTSIEDDGAIAQLLNEAKIVRGNNDAHAAMVCGV